LAFFDLQLLFTPFGIFKLFILNNQKRCFQSFSSFDFECTRKRLSQKRVVPTTLRIRWVWWYQRGNQNPYIEEEQTTQWPKEKGQKDKQRSTKHTYKTKDRVTRTLLKTGGDLRCSGRVIKHFFIILWYYLHHVESYQPYQSMFHSEDLYQRPYLEEQTLHTYNCIMIYIISSNHY
jgi:hypothetical protein